MTEIAELAEVTLYEVRNAVVYKVPVVEMLRPFPRLNVLELVPPMLIEEVVMKPVGLRKVAVMLLPVAAEKEIEVLEAREPTKEVGMVVEGE